MEATAQLIHSGRRLYLQHGPIDLIVEACGPSIEVTTAYQKADDRFRSILTELVAELPTLRQRTIDGHCEFNGAVAQRMWQATTNAGYGFFTTPMIAVAGSVADEVLAAMNSGTTLDKACVNNGGDIAVSVSKSHSYRVGVVTDLHHRVTKNNLAATLTIQQADGIGGVATSGWRGRSQSFGIADAVTVLACDAATADVAATLIANAVDLPDCKKIIRKPAIEVNPDSDLGSRLITVDVLPLTELQTRVALQAGLEVAEQLVQKGLVITAGLTLNNQYLTTNDYSILSSQREEQPGSYHYA